MSDLLLAWCILIAGSKETTSKINSSLQSKNFKSQEGLTDLSMIDIRELMPVMIESLLHLGWGGWCLDI